MLVIIAYDVETSTQEGRTRLRKVAKLCVNYGQRVQNSVFECSVDPAQLVEIKHQLEKMIDPDSDNIRIYHMGKKLGKKDRNLREK